MLKAQHYIAFDFETTGIDLQKDEPIQIGIVKFDQNFRIVDQFFSYIKPEKAISKLSDIVEFITKIDMKNIDNAPYIKDIEKDIKKFFSDDVILVWHNVQFDIWFLRKCFGRLPEFDVVDTYEWSKVFYHWKASYALEILWDELGIIQGQAHNALDDSKISMNLFQKIVGKFEILIKEYPILQNYILKSNTIWWKILDIKQIQKTTALFLPQINKEIKVNKKVVWKNVLTKDYTSRTVFNTQKITLSKLILNIIADHPKVIFTFSNRSRIEIWKKILTENFIPFSSLEIWSYIDKTKEQKLLNKKSFKDFELKFIVKYFSHYFENISIININDQWEGKVYNYLKSKVKENNSNIVFSTHQNFFNHIKEKWTESISDYHIAFFDFTYWPYGLWGIVNTWYNFFNILDMIDEYIYYLENEWEYKMQAQYEDLENSLIIFFGVLAMQFNKLFRRVNHKEIEIYNILDYLNNIWIKHLFYKIDNDISTYKWDEKFDKIVDWWKWFGDSLQWLASVKKIMYNKDRLHYIVFPSKTNIDINTLNKFTEWLNIHFFTPNFQKNWIPLKSDNMIFWDTQIIDKFRIWKINFNDLLLYVESSISNNSNIYLLSPKMMFSKALFDFMFKYLKSKWLQNIIWLFAENITWWYWKNIYYLSKDNKWTNIIIWWLEFLLTLTWNNIQAKKILTINIGGPMEKSIINDTKFYLNN